MQGTKITFGMFLFLGAMACNPENTDTAQPAPGSEMAQDLVKAPVQNPAHGQPGHVCDKKEGQAVGDCASEQGTALTQDAVRIVTDAQGRQVQHAGADFAGVPEVAIADLLANPKDYQGKTVRVSGDVSTMCVHRRGWFAVVGKDKSGQALRVFTTPSFLVPAGSIGKAAVAEGKVELIEMAPAHAKHIAEQHKLGDPKTIQGPVIQVILRATGAEFI